MKAGLEKHIRGKRSKIEQTFRCVGLHGRLLIVFRKAGSQILHFLYEGVFKQSEPKKAREAIQRCRQSNQKNTYVFAHRHDVRSVAIMCSTFQRGQHHLQTPMLRRLDTSEVLTYHHSTIVATFLLRRQCDDLGRVSSVCVHHRFVFLFFHIRQC